SISPMTEEQFQCSVCKEVFIDPVTTPCGHSFCKNCITRSWAASQRYYCPLCNESFINKPELKINITLRDVADHFKRQTVSDDILCDACTDVKQKAIKSCLDCGVTFCASHLEPHNYVPNYKKHKLINAVKNLEDYRCQKHMRPLDLFCRDDQMYVCHFCTETDHKNHNVASFEEEIGQWRSHLGKTQVELQHMIQERVEKIQEINQSVELCEKETSESVEVFTALIHSIEKSQAELLEVMEEKQKAVEKQAEGLVKELEEEIDELKRGDIRMEQLSHSDDHLYLLQIYPTVCRVPRTKNWTNVRIETDLSVKALKTNLSELQETLNKKLSVTLSEKQKNIGDMRSITNTVTTYEQVGELLLFVISLIVNQWFSKLDVTLDPETANPHLIFYMGGKQVTHGDKKQDVPDTPKRFTRYTAVLGTQGFSSGRFYYEVQVSGKTEWRLGVARESVNRKGKLEKFCPQNGFWTVILRNEDEYTARDNTYIPLSLREKPQKVGVFVDYDEGLVSFYDVEATSHIYSFTGQSFTEKIYPYL
ncbi:bloodthirsty-relatedprotein family, member 6, partial [Silurus asotus]